MVAHRKMQQMKEGNIYLDRAFEKITHAEILLCLMTFRLISMYSCRMRCW